MSRRTRKRVTSKDTVEVNLPQTETEVPLEPIFPKARPGRPNVLTPEIERRFIMAVAAGQYRAVAARMCGLAPVTVEKWIRIGRGVDTQRKPQPEYIRFAMLVDQAEAMAEAMVTNNVIKRSKYDHNAGLAWLRTRHPERWPRFPGETDADPFGRPPEQPTETRPAPDQPLVGQANVIMLGADQVPDLLRGLIAQQRAAQQVETEIEPEEKDVTPHGGSRHSRLDALRVESTADAG